MREGERGREGGGKKERGKGKDTLRERDFYVDAKKQNDDSYGADSVPAASRVAVESLGRVAWCELA